MKQFGMATGLGMAVFIAIGCASSGTATGADKSEAGGGKARATAVAVLSPAKNNPVKGTVTFTEETQGVRVVAEITGLTPGKHGFHIHEKGDCSAADFTSAGGHWNPTNAKHGAPTSPAEARHFGDFGNIEANEQGVARFARTFQWLTFTGTNSVLGKAVVVHADPDDLTSQPAGNAGARIACGVIERVAAK
jgi:superoxide dismutase, Cu-Zn family